MAMTSRPKKLAPETAKHFLDDLDGWQLARNGEAIEKRFVFADFREAFGWMTKVAAMADEMDHHPEWRNVYKTVDVLLTTHDAGGLSENDIRLAARMNALVEE